MPQTGWSETVGFSCFWILVDSTHNHQDHNHSEVGHLYSNVALGHHGQAHSPPYSLEADPPSGCGGGTSMDQEVANRSIWPWSQRLVNGGECDQAQPIRALPRTPPWNHWERGVLFLVLSYKELGVESGSSHPRAWGACLRLQPTPQRKGELRHAEK